MSVKPPIKEHWSMSLRRFPRLAVATGLAVAVAGTSLVQVTFANASGVPASAPAVADAVAHGPDDGHGHFGAGGKSLAGDYWNAKSKPETRASVDAWPAAATVVERLRAHGIEPILTEGYDDPKYEYNARLAGSGTTPLAVMMHDTGTGVPASRLQNTHSLNWILKGVKNSDGKVVRACHFYVARDGSVYFIYARRTWHAGAGDSMFGIPANKMNGYSYGIEIESQGASVQDLTQPQIDAAAKVAAAALEASQLPIERQIDHKLYAGRVQGKVDTAYDLNMWRSLTAPAIGTTYTAPYVSPNPKHISMAKMKWAASGTYVKRYQVALRKYAKARGINIKKFNPSGATGFYGSETRRLTKELHVFLGKRAWRNYVATRKSTKPGLGYPANKLIKKIGMTPIA